MTEANVAGVFAYLCHACGHRLEYREYGHWYWCARCAKLRRKPKHPALRIAA